MVNSLHKSFDEIDRDKEYEKRLENFKLVISSEYYSKHMDDPDRFFVFKLLANQQISVKKAIEALSEIELGMTPNLPPLGAEE